ncbi:UNVERIFIED_ORG: tape measure protein [Shinella sp. XGS7]|nr:tape measure protein [Shinella sp. XGS7]
MAASIEAQLRLRAQFGDVTRALAQLRKDVMSTASEASKPPPGGVPFRPMREGIASVSQQLAEVRNQFMAFIGLQAGIQGIAGIARQADEYTSLNARLRLVTDSQREFNDAQARTRALAQQYQVPLADTVTLYARLQRALKPLGGDAQATTVAVEALLASMRVNGSTVAEAGSAILQFSQALSAGALRGEEFNAMADSAPPLLDALARGLGKPRSELKSLAEQGRLTTSVVVQALQRELPQLVQQAAAIPNTIGGAVQRLRDQFAQLVGASADSGSGIKVLIGLINSLADNLGTVLGVLASIATAWGALRLAKGIGDIVELARKAPEAARALGGILSAGRGLLAVLAGPAGLVAAVFALVGGIALLDSRRGAKSTEALQKERDALKAELAALNADMKDSNATAPQALLSKRETQLKLARVEARLAAQQQQEWDKLRLSAGARGGPGMNASGELLDPAAIKSFEDQYKTRDAIVKYYEDERAGYVRAKDKEIAAAASAGDTARQQKLSADKRKFLAEQAKAEEDALRKWAADDTITRMAVYRERFDREAALTADATQRELAINQSLYDQRLRSAQDYFTERERLENLESEQSIAKLEQELAAKQKVLAENRAALDKAHSANDKAAAKETVTANEAEVEKARLDIVQARRDQADKARQRQIDSENIARELRDQRTEMDAQTKALQDQVTLADLRLSIERKYREQREREFIETGSTAQTDALVAAEQRVAELQRLQRQYEVLHDAIRQQESQNEQMVGQGLMTTVEAERKKFDARDRVVPQLRAILDAMSALASTDAERTYIAKLKQEVDGLADRATEMGNTVRRSIGSGFGQLFTDVAMGSKAAGEAFRDFLSGVARSALNLIGQRLGEQLAASLLPSGGGGGKWLASAASFLTSMFHQGGVVGKGGGRMMAPLAAFVAAPRYHSGGIAGLRPNEVPAVLERGEEVLTENSPRHIKNYRGGVSMGDLNVSVTVEGTNYGKDPSRLAGNLAEGIRRAVYDVLSDESREGGMLSARS